MNWEALTVIGLFAVVLGMVLYLPARFLIRRRLRSAPVEHANLKLTRVGWLMVGIMLVILFGGFSAQYVAPESVIGHFVKASGGWSLYAAIVGTVFWFIELALKRRGINLIDRSCSRAKEQCNSR